MAIDRHRISASSGDRAVTYQPRWFVHTTLQRLEPRGHESERLAHVFALHRVREGGH